MVTDQPDPYLWRHREGIQDTYLDMLFLPIQGEELPEEPNPLEEGDKMGETTIVWW